MLRFPLGQLARFCHNHGLLQLTDRPQWRTVEGGSRNYVEKIIAGVDDARLNTPVQYVLREDDRVLVVDPYGTEAFDRVVIAAHPDEALAMLSDASVEEGTALGAIRYQRNRAVLHTDASVLPARRSAWAAWNYESAASGPGAGVCVHYLINRLQPLPWQSPVIVSLNPIRPIDPGLVAAEFDYAHPVFDQSATLAQARLAGIQGRRHTWFCGAWTGYGFHEDGLVSGERAARELLLRDRIERAEVAQLQAA
jgi:predicted NAD/FAD-binding protein